MANMYEIVKRALQEVIAPDLARIEGRIESLGGEITGLKAEIIRLDEKIESVRNELGTKIDIALDIRERLSTLETKVDILTASSNPPDHRAGK